MSEINEMLNNSLNIKQSDICIRFFAFHKGQPSLSIENDSNENKAPILSLMAFEIRKAHLANKC